MWPLYTPHHIANEVRLKRTQHRGSFLLVEGSDDSRAYKRFFQPYECRVVLAFSKDNVISAIRLLDDEAFKGALGLVDSDFDKLDCTRLPSENLVRADCHDLEAMIIRSNALDIVLHEFASAEKLSRFQDRHGFSVREWLLETARPLGYLRWNSLRRGLNLWFRGLRFSNFVDPRTLKLHPAKLLTEVRNRSMNWAISDQELTQHGWPQNHNDDPWQLCCGHDMVDLLTLALKRAIGSEQNLATEQVASSLRLAFNHQDFAQTELRAAIQQWKTKTGFTVLIPASPACEADEAT